MADITTNTPPSSKTPENIPTSLSTAQVAFLPQNEPFTPPVHSVKDFHDYDFYGRFSTLLPRLPEAAKFITNNTNDVDNKDTESPDYSRVYNLALAAVTSFLNTCHRSCKTPKSCCWFTIRMTKAADEFVVPRWHCDGNFYNTDFSTYSPEIIGTSNASKPDDDDNDDKDNDTYQLTNTSPPPSKFATTLLGPPTLLLNIPHTPHLLTYLHDRETESDFVEQWRKDDKTERRERIDAYLVPDRIERAAPSTTEPNTNGNTDSGAGVGTGTPSLPSNATLLPDPAPGQIVRFAWGSRYAVVHSEPDMRLGDRVFVSVLFGSEAQMRHMTGYREVQFHE